MADTQQKTPLNLAENIRMALTREEWAVLLIGLSHIPRGQLRLGIDKMADRLSDHIQEHAAPAGVLARVIRGEIPPDLKASLDRIVQIATAGQKGGVS